MDPYFLNMTMPSTGVCLLAHKRCLFGNHVVPKGGAAAFIESSAKPYTFLSMRQRREPGAPVFEDVASILIGIVLALN